MWCTLITDHKQLTFTLWVNSQGLEGRHLSYVAEFTSDLRHISCQDNVVAKPSHPSWGELRPLQQDQSSWTTAQRNYLYIEAD